MLFRSEMLESFHPSESKVLLAVKDQNLEGLYKNVTHQLVYDAGMIDVAPEVKEEEKKRGRGRPRKLSGTEGLE